MTVHKVRRLRSRTCNTETQVQVPSSQAHRKDRHIYFFIFYFLHVFVFPCVSFAAVPARTTITKAGRLQSWVGAECTGRASLEQPSAGCCQMIQAW